MATTIAPEEMYFGAPVSLTYGGVEMGATVDPPKVTITPTVYSPAFQNAGGPVKGTDIVTKILVAAEFTVNQITAQKLGFTMPGSTTAGDFTTWSTGRIPSAAYKDLVMTGVGLDGRHMIITITNAINVSAMEIDFSDSSISGLKVKMEGRYDGALPLLAPFEIDLAASGSAS